jgi:hypothetical protein
MICNREEEYLGRFRKRFRNALPVSRSAHVVAFDSTFAITAAIEEQELP